MQSLNPNMKIPKSTLGEGLIKSNPIIEQDTYVETTKIATHSAIPFIQTTTTNAGKTIRVKEQPKSAKKFK